MENIKTLLVAFKAFSRAKKAAAIVFLVVILIAVGAFSGLLVTANSFGLQDVSFSLGTLLKNGLFSLKGILLTLLIAVIAAVFLLIAIAKKKPRAFVTDVDKETGAAYSSTGSQGGMRWMSPVEAREKFMCGNVEDLFGYIYGKLMDETGDAVTFRPHKYGAGNKNTLILGQPGTGKSFSLIRNELIQALRRLESFVCTDPKGELFTDTSEFAKLRTDFLWAINFLDPEHSCAWNLMKLVINPKTGRLDDDKLEKFASTYMTNAVPDTPDRSDFWYIGAVNLFQAIIGLVAYEHEEYIRTTLLDATQTILTRIGSAETVPAVIRHNKKYSLVNAEKIFRKTAHGVLTESEIDNIVTDIKNSAPPFTISQVYYEVMKLQSASYDDLKTRLSVLPKSHPAVACFTFFNNPDVKAEVKASTAQGLGQRMSPLRNENIRRMLSHDDVDILQINQKQCAVYLIVPDNSDRYKALTSLFFKFMFDELSYTWDTTSQKCKERGIDTLQVLRPVSVVMDEFANIGEIPEFDQFMSTGRGRQLNVTIACQYVGQLHKVYGDDNANTIKNDCDTVLFLGTNDEATAEWMSSFILGVTTIITQSYSAAQGRVISSMSEKVTESEQQRFLAYASELRKFIDHIICAQHGKDPLKLDLFGYTEHPESRWFRFRSIESTYEPISKRFPEVDPLLIEDLKEIEQHVWKEEQERARIENRTPVRINLVQDKAKIALDNRYRILHEIEAIINYRMAPEEEDALDLDSLEPEIEINLDDMEMTEPKVEVIDSTYREISDKPKKPKKKNKKKKKTDAPKPVEYPADESELND